MGNTKSTKRHEIGHGGHGRSTEEHRNYKIGQSLCECPRRACDQIPIRFHHLRSNSSFNTFLAKRPSSTCHTINHYAGYAGTYVGETAQDIAARKNMPPEQASQRGWAVRNLAATFS